MNAFTEYVPPPSARTSAVYVLMYGNRVVYVGQTTDLDQRVVSHRARRNHRNASFRLRFNRVLWVAVEPADLVAYEGAIARALNPSKTNRVSTDASRDAEILAVLGLAPDETRAFERRITENNLKNWRRVKRERTALTRKRAKRAARVQAFARAS